MNNIFGDMFMRVQKGMCMLSPCGIAVKTSAGYRSYNVKTGKLRNCDTLVFGFGDSMFFVVPASKVKTGDIILNGGKPACVRKSGKNSIEVINYETSVVETILPERHVFMGNTYFYGKIVSIFGDGSSICGKGSVTRMMKFMMLGSLMGNGTDTENGIMPAQGSQGGMGILLPLMLMKGEGFDDLFGGLFEEEEDNADDCGDEDDLF